MADIFSKNKRSNIMSKIAKKDTPQEVIVRKFLFEQGYRFRINYKRLPGSPDIVLPKYKVVVFVHGCFWHGHACKAGSLPKSNLEFWTKKIDGNIKRDKRKNYQLKKLGWKVLNVWQCKLENKIISQRYLSRLLTKIRISTTAEK